ncbi:MAG: hypothetical protein GY853_13840 [PVC group bacterium]|nr:hypothetical protein [PVC group bacterium]
MRKLLCPTTDQTDKVAQDDRVEYFAHGIIKDAPASKIPKGALSDGFNISTYPSEIIGRTGSELYTTEEIPAIPSYTGITAYKIGNRIIAMTPIFLRLHVSNYFVWPVDEDNFEHDEIIQYVSTTEVVTKLSGDRELTPFCYIRGKNNQFGFHKQRKKWVRQFWRKYYYSDIDMDDFEESIIISRDVPANSKSHYQDLDDNAAASFNSNGIFKISFKESPSIAYKINCPVPNTPIAPKPKTGNSEHSYRYWYSAAILSGNDVLRSRLDKIKIESETGTNDEDLETTDAGLDELWTNNVISTSNPNVVGPLWVPIVPNTDPQEYQWHYSHYPIYRTLDIQGRLEDPYYREYNDPNRAVWAHDLRISGAFYAYKTRGLIIAEVGFFEIADVGSTIEDEEGNRDEILEYISSRVVRYMDVGEYDYLEESPLMAYAIGNGRVIRASQSGNLVTRTNGDTFTSADVRKTLQWANGYRNYIVEIISGNVVRVSDEVDKETQGVTLDPRYRYFNDTVTDDQLKSRLPYPTLLLNHRFWQPLPNCNIGVVSDGFMTVAIRNQNIYYYSQISQGLEYTVGFYHPTIQLSRTIKDDIQLLWVFPNNIVVWTSNKTYAIQTNQADIVAVPHIGEAVATLPGAQTLDGDKGCFDWGSVQDIGNGEVVLLTSEPGLVGIRIFNGVTYGNNRAYIDELGMGRLSRLLNSIQHATTAIYNAHDGYLVWGYREDD